MQRLPWTCLNYSGSAVTPLMHSQPVDRHPSWIALLNWAIRRPRRHAEAWVLIWKFRKTTLRAAQGMFPLRYLRSYRIVSGFRLAYVFLTSKEFPKGDKFHFFRAFHTTGMTFRTWYFKPEVWNAILQGTSPCKLPQALKYGFRFLILFSPSPDYPLRCIIKGEKRSLLSGVSPRQCPNFIQRLSNNFSR